MHKPFHPESQQHKEFLSLTLEKLENFSEDLEKEYLTLVAPISTVGLGFTIFSIYLIATWSEKWNKEISNI